MSNIEVSNYAGHPVEVSINTWGYGSTGYYTINQGAMETWSRSDDRGFIMAVRRGSIQYSFVVWANYRCKVTSATDDEIRVRESLMYLTPVFTNVRP